MISRIKRKIRSGIKMIFNSDIRFIYLLNKGIYENKSDEYVIRREYKAFYKRALDLQNPVRYTEKLQWLKLYDRKDIYTTMVDKYMVKKYVSDLIGEEYVIPTLYVWDDVEDINFDDLPNSFVLKCTHDSGSIVICKDKSVLDVNQAKSKLEFFMRRNYYKTSREWPYKNVKPRIICEPYLEDLQYKELRDYKFFTFGGVPKALYIAQGRGGDGVTLANFFDMDFKHLEFCIDHEMSQDLPDKPVNFEKMKELAGILSKGTPQLRVDFYEVNGRLYFGEMTFFHCSGFIGFKPDKWDYTFGEWVTLPK